MQLIQATAIQWGLQHKLPPMLCEAGAECAPEQDRGCKAACSDCTTQGRTHTGADIGVRRPDADETPLSDSEILVGMRDGVF